MEDYFILGISSDQIGVHLTEGTAHSRGSDLDAS